MKDKYILAVDIGATNLRMALVDSTGKIHNLKKIEGYYHRGDIVSQIRDKIESSFPSRAVDNVAGIAISVAGPVNEEEGSAVLTNLGMQKTYFKRGLENIYGEGAVLIHDADAAALAEKYYGKGKNHHNLVYITISSGIGVGIIKGGKLVKRGKGERELGHSHIESNFSMECAHGDHNCWESFASGVNLPSFFNKWARKVGIREKEVEKAKEIFDLRKNKDKNAENFLAELNRINGSGVSSVIEAAEPAIIIFGGAVALANGKVLLPGIKKNIRKGLPIPEMEITDLGDEISLLGAAEYFRISKSC